MVVCELLACTQSNCHKPPQRFRNPTVECPWGGDVRKYASAEKQVTKTTVRHLDFTKKVYRHLCMAKAGFYASIIYFKIDAQP